MRVYFDGSRNQSWAQTRVKRDCPGSSELETNLSICIQPVRLRFRPRAREHPRRPPTEEQQTAGILLGQLHPRGDVLEEPVELIPLVVVQEPSISLRPCARKVGAHEDRVAGNHYEVGKIAPVPAGHEATQALFHHLP